MGLTIELKMGLLIEQSPHDVKDFVRDRYIESRNGTFGRLKHLESKRHTVALTAEIDGEKYYVHIDYVFGEFLINGLPMGRLPATITSLPIFKRIFGNSAFEVQPRHRVFSTVLPYNGSYFIFREHNDEGVVILETSDSDGDCVKQLIPHTKMSGIVPFQLMENYSHWWNRVRSTIEFRPKSFRDADFTSVKGIHYELDLIGCCLKHVKSGRFLLDVRSRSYTKIVGLLVRLENPHYINIVMDEPLKARVELLRMNLNFIIDCTHRNSHYQIESNEWRGMRVSSSQNIGTLYGLRFGLVLESMDETTPSRLLIVPHGKFIVKGRESKTSHITVDIDVAEDAQLRKPAFFEYRVNNECRILKANSYAAWFYLAHLHAVTSFPLPDPFTGTKPFYVCVQFNING